MTKTLPRVTVELEITIIEHLATVANLIKPLRS